MEEGATRQDDSVSCARAPHVPVLVDALLEVAAPVHGIWVDATLGAGGHALALIRAGAERVIGIDRDPEAHREARKRAACCEFADRLSIVDDHFANIAHHANDADGVLMDLGMSSMQVDRAERGFSCTRDGPLDMRMSGKGATAADLVSKASEARLAGILSKYGEERAARRIARAICQARHATPITHSGQLAELVSGCLPERNGWRRHPATQTFQALRIWVNDEFAQLHAGLSGAEQVLRAGGILAVISFHSIEDRIVKRFLRLRAGVRSNANRHAPACNHAHHRAAAFDLDTLGARIPKATEIAANPRARSARLRFARRNGTPSGWVPARDLGIPQMAVKA